MDVIADLEEYKFMFKQRLISGIILVLIAAFGLYMGGVVTFAMTLIVALIGYSEILRIYHIEKSSLAVIGYTGTILYYVALFFDLEQWTTAIIILFLIFLLGCYVVRFPKYKVDQMMAAFFGFVYVGVMMSFIYQIREYAAEADLRGIKLEYARKGVKIYAAAIGEDRPRIERIYGDGYLDITNLQELPVMLTNLIVRSLPH